MIDSTEIGSNMQCTCERKYPHQQHRRQKSEPALASASHTYHTRSLDRDTINKSRGNHTRSHSQQSVHDPLRNTWAYSSLQTP